MASTALISQADIDLESDSEADSEVDDVISDVVSVVSGVVGSLIIQSLIESETGCHRVRIDDFKNKIKDNAKWESDLLLSRDGYPYKLIVRPNGLRFTKGHNKCVGIWFKPMPYNLRETARIKLSIAVESPTKTEVEGLSIPTAEYTWDKKDVISQNPAFSFDLTAIKHSAIEQAKCVGDDGNLTLCIEEQEFDQLRKMSM